MCFYSKFYDRPRGYGPPTIVLSTVYIVPFLRIVLSIITMPHKKIRILSLLERQSLVGSNRMKDEDTTYNHQVELS